jgi:hypothetical protein
LLESGFLNFRVRLSQMRSLTATSFLQKLDFLKEGVNWEQSNKIKNC